MTSSRSRPRPRRLGLLLYPGCMPAGLLATADMVRAVNRRAGRGVCEVVWLGLTPQPIVTEDGLTLRPQQTLAESRCDVCLVPGFWTETEADLEVMLERQAKLIAALREGGVGQAVWGYCAGVALTAAAGLLDGKAATGTWWFQRFLQQRFRRVRWRFTEPLVSDRGAVTAAGAQGHWLLVTQQLAQWVSAEVMRDVEHVLMLPRPPTAHPAFRPVELMAQPSAELKKLLVHAQSIPASELSLGTVAEHCAVSPRTLRRRIEAHAGLPAGAWLRLVKLRQVSEALTTSLEPLKVIGEQLGYLNESSLHRAFKQVTGMTPVHYRQAFGNVKKGR
ncbi:AraC family transcriptional regulator [Myxococcus stipitatus DSM 14675]|uniref:AraC family transcriptional regulator n=1 Tax=Myxococcus stipitatus (strain DSM 14675 / JCM 12634 / Mx s8) TaxID=1278073 RepID=L7UJZ0_MYXSD|nr:helix-turn-helix domain-containing protein [Myxococcus stipitatus]AGC48225.1 AraC family transcriptional regulator [Myxococcus stipitatus DSM 14675]